MQTRQVMSSPQWQQKQQQLITAYRQVAQVLRHQAGGSL